jgi:Rrf2 family protein
MPRRPRSQSIRWGFSPCDDVGVHISAKVDYATQALLALAAEEGGRMVRGEDLAVAHGLPVKFVENTLVELRQAGIVVSQRGRDGGYQLARPASEIMLADVIRALEGPLAEVRGQRPERASYAGPAQHLRDVWVAVRAALRLVLESVSLADVVDGRLPEHVADLVDPADAWEPRPVGGERPAS